MTIFIGLHQISAPFEAFAAYVPVELFAVKQYNERTTKST